MSKVKILLKLILIAIIVFVFLAIFKINYVQAADSKTGNLKINSSGILYNASSGSSATASAIAKQIQNNRNALLDANLISLMGATVDSNSAWTSYYTAGCFAHWRSTTTKSYGGKFMVRQAIYFGINSSGNYVATNYYLSGSKGKSQTITQSKIASNNLGKLAGAIIYQINTAKATYKATVGSRVSS